MIGFRLDPTSIEILQGLAEQRKISTHELCRVYVLQALHGEQSDSRQHETLIDLRQQSKQLRADLSLVAHALLVGAGKISDADARQWVQENIGVDRAPGLADEVSRAR